MGLLNINDGYKRKYTPYMTKYKPIIEKNNPNDKVYTPENVAKDIIDTLCKKFTVYGKILEPCRGNGAFYNNFPKTYGVGIENQLCWCEIDEGVDFFDYKEKVNWIITNPPYSCFDEFLVHIFELADFVAFLIPINKITSSYSRIQQIHKYGGIPYIKIYKGKDCNFPFGFACGLVVFQKGYKGDIKVEC